MSSKSSIAGQQQGRQSRARATRQELVELGMIAQQIGEMGLAELQRKVESGEPLNLTVDQIVSLLTAGVELERKARGEPPS